MRYLTPSLLRNRPLACLFVAFSAALVCVAGAHYRQEEERFKATVDANLSAVADLKATQVASWLSERLGDGRVIGHTALLTGELAEWIDGQRSPGRTRLVRQWLVGLRDGYRYDSVSLLSARGDVLLQAPKGAPPVSDAELKVLPQALRGGKVTLADLHVDPGSAHAYLSVIAPLPVGQDDATTPVGAVVLRIDPATFLFPLIQSWPTASPTAETLLVRREGAEAVFLNRLRHSDNQPLSMRLPLNQPGLPAAYAAKGFEGSMRGVDYRRVPVLAATRRVRGAPWYIVAKVDVAEVYAPLRQRAYVTLGLVVLLVALAAAMLRLAWRSREAAFLLAEREANLERRALVEHFGTTARYANDIILLWDEDYRIVEANERAVEAYGYPRSELLGMSLRRIHAREAVGEMRTLHSGLLTTGDLRAETLHRRRNGSSFPVEESSRAMRIEGKLFGQSIIRDITERKRAEEALESYRSGLERLVLSRTVELTEANRGLSAEIARREQVEANIRSYQESLRRLVLQESQVLYRLRQDLAIGLHDNVAQQVAAAKMHVKLAAHAAAESHSQSLREAVALLDEVLGYIRSVTFELSPPLLDELGFGPALQWLGEQFTARHGLKVSCDCTEEARELSSEARAILFRAVSELLSNAVKHAGVTEAAVGVRIREGLVVTTVSDAGAGFDPAAVGPHMDATGGFGLLSIREQLRRIGGSMEVRASPGHGVCITLTAPLGDAAAPSA